MFKGIRYIFSFFILFVITGQVMAQNPFLTKYDAVKRSERCYTVTWEDYSQFGSVWWVDKVDFAQDTAFNFVVYMGDRDGNGADGIAFVLHHDPRDTIDDPSAFIGNKHTSPPEPMYQEGATGEAGGGLGYADHASYEWNQLITPSIAIEFDTWNNSDVPDGREGTDGNGVYQPRSPYYGWDHTSLVYNGHLYTEQQIIEDKLGNKDRILPLKPSYAFGTSNNPDGSPFHNIEDNRCYMFQVRWIVNNDGTQTIQLWADIYNGSTNTSGLELIMTHTDSILTKVFGGESLLRFGFTGSTGGAINEQTICLLGENLKPFAADDYASIPMNTTTVIDVESNDNDPDGDELHVPIIVVPPKNGSAVILDSLGINYLRYTPNANYVGKDSVSYTTCDVNSTKCYAKCDTAWVHITVGCIPFDVTVNQTNPNVLCVDTLPANGSARAETSGLPALGTIWYEGFSDLADGTTVDNGPTAWSFHVNGTCSPGNQIRVQNFRFRARKTGCEVVWETEDIDISPYTDISVSINLEATGNMESDDYLQVYYVLDGGAETPLTNGLFTDNFGTAQATASGLNGNTLRIIVKAKNSGGDENYFWDDLLIRGIGAPSANVTYHWYAGPTASGPEVYTGQTYTGMSHGTYTVVAEDNFSGCLSNPATVTIDSTGQRPPNGYVKPVAPFTTCGLPYDGALEAGVFDGTDSLTNGYTFEWYYRESPGVGAPIRVGYLAEQLEGREYSVVITDNATGCDTLVSGAVSIEVHPPVVSASVLSDVYSCRNPNSGVAEANVGGETGGYTFDWYEGPVITAGLPDYTGDTVRTLPAGTFTVRATDTVTSCVSNPVSVTVNSNLVYPVPLANVNQQQISCDPSSPTGALSASVDLGGGNTTITGFTFNWYKGLNNVVPARPGYTGGPLADRLSAGDYRLIVENDTTGCEATLDMEILELTVDPVISNVQAHPVTTCLATPDGSLDISVAGNPPEMKYQIYKGTGINNDSLIANTTSTSITGLPAGNYTVTATDTVTHCISDAVFATIDDAHVNPMANITSGPQVSCDPARPTGTLTASVSTDPMDFTFTWHENDINGNVIGTTGGVNGEIANQLPAGQYTLLISDNTTGCTNVLPATVNDDITLPVIDAVTSTPSTGCGTASNGTVSTTVNSGSTDETLYYFRWENTDDALVLSDTSATVGGLKPGHYQVTVTDRSTACSSGPAGAQVWNSRIIPDPVLSPVHDTSCDPATPNGGLQVTAVNNGSGALSDYSYEWFIGNSGGTKLDGPPYAFSADSSQISNLGANTYALRITDRTSTCSNEVLIQVRKLSYIPTIDPLAITDATRCTEPFMSSAEVTSVNGSGSVPASYSFIWINQDLNGQVLNDTTALILDDVAGDGLEIPPGNYSVVAINEYHCLSDTLHFKVNDQADYPDLTLHTTENSSCNNSMPNGWITAIRNNNTLNITGYEWFVNNTSGPGLPSIPTAFLLPGDSIAGGLPGGTYALQVTADNGCTGLEFASINDHPAPPPSIDTTYTKDLTTCIPANGEIGLKVVPLETLPPDLVNNRTYSFYINEGSTIADTTSGNYDFRAVSDPGANPDRVAFNGLGSGSWTGVVMDHYTHCASAPMTVQLDPPRVPDLNISASPPASCNSGATGTLELTASASDGTNEPPGTGPGYDFTWYVDIGTSNPLTSNVSSDNQWHSKASNINAGYYTVTIFNKLTKCEIDTVLYLPPSSTPSFISTNVTDATQCAPMNGAVSLVMGNMGTVPGTPPRTADHRDYEYILFKGSTFDPNWSGTGEADYVDGSSIPAGGPIVFQDLDTGVYTIVAREKAPPFTTQCFSNPKTFRVNLDFNFTLNPSVINADNTCSGAPTGNGQVDAAIVSAGGGHTYTWYRGNATDVPANVIYQSNANGLSPDTLSSGPYSIKVEVTSGSGNGCIFTNTVIVPKINDELKIASAPVIDVTKCSIDNGEIYIEDISENGTSLGGTTGYGNFRIYDDQFTELTPNGTGTAAGPWDGLSAASYYLTAQNLSTYCYTDPLKVIVHDSTTYPEVAVDIIMPDFSCDGVNPNGELHASSTGGSVSTTEYSFVWYKGTDTGNPAMVLPAPHYTPGTDPHIARDLYAGAADSVYTIVVTDLTGRGEGCATIQSVRLPHQNSDIEFSKPLLTVDPKTWCIPNGKIVAGQIDEDNSIQPPTSTVPDYTGIYDLQLLDENLNPVTDPFGTADLTTGSFTQLPGGTYYIQAINMTTGCGSIPVQAIIRDEAMDPVVAVNQLSADYSCPGGTPTGHLEALAFGGSDFDNNNMNFAYSWYLKGTNTPPDTYTDGTFPPHAVNLPAGTYTVVVTDTSGADRYCETTVDYTVEKRSEAVIMSDYANTDQNVCFPDGTITLNEIQMDGNPINVTDPAFSVYEILLTDNDMNPLSPAGSGIPADPYRELGAGTYVLRIRDTVTNCYSQPQQIIIHDTSTDPLVTVSTLSPQYSLNPDPASWTGALQAAATESDGSYLAPGYTYEWHLGNDPSSPVYSGDSLISRLDSGAYTLKVISDSTACQQTVQITLPFVFLEPTFHTNISDQTVCAPLDGEIEITEIFLDNVTDTLSQYVFRGYYENYNPGNPDTVFFGDDTRTAWSNLPSGTYYIVAKERRWWLKSDPVQIHIDNTSTSPEIALDGAASAPMTGCDPDLESNGALAVIAYEPAGPPQTYTYSWYDENGSVITDSTRSTITGLPAGLYTVKVTNTNNLCESEKTFAVEDKSALPLITESASPLTNCDPANPNGMVTAFVTNAAGSQNQEMFYDFNWYEGSDVKPAPDYTGQSWQNLPVGTYTVKVVNKSLTSCISAPVTIEINNATRNPEIETVELSPLTNCDPELANASYAAKADGMTDGYLFEWFDQKDTLYFTGPNPTTLKAETYRLEVTNISTGCKSEAELTPSSSPDYVPPPQVDILSERTSCNEPDGRTTASVNGNVTDYMFTYYDAGTHAQLTNFTEDNIIYDLDSGSYYVIAKSRYSGCESDPSPFSVADNTYYPEFDVVSNPSSCDDPTGYSEVILKDKTLPFKVRWYLDDGSVGSTDEGFYYLPIGTYQVEVEGSDGCFTVKDFKITGDITIYNGVSANNDGMNDYFQIFCLEYFPDNHVQIFNRSGMLVFEMDGYDMYDETKRFNGIANRGVSMGSQELPIGTYFYVVDKRDGSKPKVGYLELKR